MSDITLKDIIVANKIHGKEDITCQGTLANPKHKLSEKADQSYVIEQLSNAKAIVNIGEDIVEDDLTYYPLESEDGNIIRNGSQVYQVTQEDILEINYNKLHTGEISYQDIADLFNENSAYIPDDSSIVADCFYGDRPYYGDSTGLVLSHNNDDENNFNFYLFDFNTIVGETTNAYVESVEISYKLQNNDNGDEGEYELIFGNINGSETFAQITATLEEQTSIFEDIDIKYIGCTISPINTALIITKLVLHLKRRQSVESSTSPFYVWKKIIIDVNDLETPTEQTRGKFYRNTINEEINYTEKGELKDEWVKVTDTNSIVNGDYLIVGNENETDYCLDGSIETAGRNFIGNNPLPIIITGNKILQEEQTDIENLNSVCVHIEQMPESDYFSIKADSGVYIGATGTNNIMSYNNGTIRANSIEITDGNAVIIDTQNTNKPVPLKINYSNNAAIFRYYKSTSSPIKPVQLYKHVTVEPYEWKQLVNKEQISKVGFTGKYNDLLNKPVLGDVIINDYDNLPKATSEYEKILARYDESLYTLTTGDGWDFNPIKFSNDYSSDSSKNVNFNDYFNNNIPDLGLNPKPSLVTDIWSTIVDEEEITNYSYRFESYKCNTQNKNGIQIGTSSIDGYLRLLLDNRDNRNDYFTFSSVTLGFKPYINKSTGIPEIGKVNIDLGFGGWDIDNHCISVPSPIASDSITVTENKEYNVTINTNDVCNYISFASDGEVGRRIILTTLYFNDLKYYRYNEDIESYEEYKFNGLLQWKKITGNGSSEPTEKPYVKNKILYL